MLRSKDVTRVETVEDLLRVQHVGEGSENCQGNPDGAGSSATPHHSMGSDLYSRQQLEEENAHKNGMAVEALNKARQENQLRTDFFGVAIGMAIFVLVAANAGVLTYLAMAGKDAESTVLVAWLVSVVAEVIVIMHIIAKYLFPNPPGNQ